MIYLSGFIGAAAIDGIGYMRTPNSHHGQMPAGSVWAGDSGRFSSPATYSDRRYLAWLARRQDGRCLFATAPDVVGDHAATLALSAPMFGEIRRLGYRVAFVAQDGFNVAPWDDFDCLFIGGTTEFKCSAAVPGIIAEARRRGKWTHMGRVNSYQRMRVAKAIGCRSVDGTFLKFGPQINTARLRGWLERIDGQLMLEMHQ